MSHHLIFGQKVRFFYKKISFQEGGGYPSTLQMVLVPKVSPAMCDEAYSPAYTVTSTMLCAGVPEGGKDACQVSFVLQMKLSFIVSSYSGI